MQKSYIVAVLVDPAVILLRGKNINVPYIVIYAVRR